MDDFLDRFTVSQFRVGRNAGSDKFAPDAVQICLAFFDLRTRRVFAVILRQRAGGHVKQNDAALHPLRQLFDVFDNRPVSRGAIQRHENGFIHVCAFPAARHHPPAMMCHAALSDSGKL